MDEQDVALLQGFKDERRKLLKRLRESEALQLEVCNAVGFMPPYNRFWLERARIHLKEGMLALRAAVDMENISDEQILSILLQRGKGVADAKTTNDKGDQNPNQNGAGDEMQGSELPQPA